MKDRAVFGHLDPPRGLELRPEINATSHTNAAQHVVEYCFAPGGSGKPAALPPMLFRCHIPSYPCGAETVLDQNKPNAGRAAASIVWFHLAPLRELEAAA